MRRKPPADPVTPSLYHFVRDRDRYACVGPLLPAAVPGVLEPCSGAIELDHVHNAGKGRRGPSRAWNLVSLCSGTHHPAKTANAKVWRVALDEYILANEPTARIDPEAAKYLTVPG